MMPNPSQGAYNNRSLLSADSDSVTAINYAYKKGYTIL